MSLLIENYDVLDNIHLVGHSLGAHVVGFCAKKLQETGVGKIKRLTGLDPAFPFFELAGVHGRLDKSDAELVQIVHTNSGWLWQGCLSFEASKFCCFSIHSMGVNIILYFCLVEAPGSC